MQLYDFSSIILMQLLKLALIFEKLAGRWDSYIKGEYWIDQWGQSTFADQDIGDVGHEMEAADSMLNKDILIDGLIENTQSSGDYEPEEMTNRIKELEEYRSDELGASAVFFNEQIPDEIGAQAAGSMEEWLDIKNDVRLAYVKWHKAIHVINSSFSVWEVNATAIKHIQDFLWEQLEGIENINEIDEDVTVEEVKSQKFTTMSLNEFLQIKHPGELWR